MLHNLVKNASYALLNITRHAPTRQRLSLKIKRYP